MGLKRLLLTVPCMIIYAMKALLAGSYVFRSFEISKTWRLLEKWQRIGPVAENQPFFPLLSSCLASCVTNPDIPYPSQTSSPLSESELRPVILLGLRKRFFSLPFQPPGMFHNGSVFKSLLLLLPLVNSSPSTDELSVSGIRSSNAPLLSPPRTYNDPSQRCLGVSQATRTA